jgi:tetratricopeptide (TPR) repeat protein
MRTFLRLFCIFIITLFCSCGKKYLDLQQEKNQRVPVSLDDFQKLLDQTVVINESCPVSFANIGADEYWVPASQYYATTGALPAACQVNAYIWADQIYVGKETQIDWNQGYSPIYLTNLALEYINSTSRTDAQGAKYDRLKGSALFIRAFNFYNMAQLFCPVYSETNASLPLGLSLRETSDPTVNVPRSTVAATYQKIISDLNEAAPLLNDKPDLVFHASKAAVYALLSRVYMQMGDYASAEKATDNCLKIQSDLLDFNTVALTAGNTLTFGLNGKKNPEVIYMAVPFLTQLFNWYHADTTLVRSYEQNDIRLKAYFSDTTTSIANVVFKGSYKGNTLTSYFCGFATDEVYLNRAESRARNQNTPGALDDLNLLRKARFTNAAYAPLQSTDNGQVMQWILAERRKELVLRSTRWADLRRLNKEPQYATTLIRILNDQRFELAPGSLKWVWPLPIEAITNGGYNQNPR